MTDTERFVTQRGDVHVESGPAGDWVAGCVRCGAGCGATGGPADDDGSDYEDEQYDRFLAEHRDCKMQSLSGEPLAAPLPAPASAPESRRQMWVVKCASGGTIRVLAERHTTYARPDGTELRFHDGDGEAQRRVATVRAGSWHWCAAEAALESGSGERS